MYYRIAPEPPKTTIKRGGAFSYWRSPYYDEGFKVALLAFIPRADRRWYKERQVWAVRIQHTEQLADLVEQFYLRRPETEEAQ